MHDERKGFLQYSAVIDRLLLNISCAISILALQA